MTDATERATSAALDATHDAMAKPPPEAEAKAAHTPGPWRLKDSALVTADNDTGLAIARVYHAGYPADAEANARLIAAAPDLLAAAQKAVACKGGFWATAVGDLRQHCTCCGVAYGEDHLTECDLAPLYEALTRATGGPK